MADINPVLQAASIEKAQSGVTTLAIQANTAAVQDSYSKSADILKMIGDNNALQSTVAGMAALQTQQANSTFALAMQDDQKDVAGRQRKLASTVLENDDKQTAALNEINAKKAISFFSDPAGWLSAQFTINNDIDAHNAAASASSTASEQLLRMNQLTKDTVLKNTALTETLSIAGVEAGAKNTVHQASLLAMDAIRNGIVANTAGVVQLQAQSVTQMQVETSLYSTQAAKETEAKNYSLAVQHLELATQNSMRAAAEFDWRKAEKDESKQFDAEMTSRVNAGYIALGFPLSQLPDSSKIKTFIQSHGKGVPLDPVMAEAFRIGTMNQGLDRDGGTRVLATSPVQYGNLKDTVRIEIPIAMRSADALFNKAASEIKGTQPFVNAIAAKDVIARDKIVNTAVQNAFDEAAKEVKDPSNPYWLPAMGEIVAKSPALMELALYKNVLAPLEKAGVELTTPANVYQQGLIAVGKGDITLNQFALDYATIYARGQRLNVEASQINNMGIIARKSYNTPVSGIVFSGTVIDNTDVTAVLRQAMVDMRSNRFTTKNVNPFASLADGIQNNIDPDARNIYYRQLGMKPTPAENK